MSAPGLCPICDGEMPTAKQTGRPRQFCTAVCTERARSRRKQAARLLEYAEVVEHGDREYAPTEEIRLRRVAARQGKAQRLRQDAADLLEGIGPG